MLEFRALHEQTDLFVALGLEALGGQWEFILQLVGQSGARHCILDHDIARFVALCERDGHVAQRRIGHLLAKHVEQVIITAVNEPSGADAEASAIYVMDRGYVDFARLYVLHQAGAFFVTRAKSNLDAHRVYSASTDRAAGIIADQTIALDGYATSKDYPIHLRRVRFKDPESGKTLVFLTNQFALPAASICALYKSRWQVELFFKWIKQHLRIKQFYGTSDNAVKTQIWIAVSVYVLVAIVKKRLALDASLYTLLQVFSVTLFEKIPMPQALSETTTTFEDNEVGSQLNLFSF